MLYLAAILVSVALLSGFLALTNFEAARGARFMGGVRARVDEGASRASFVFQHVDWGAFANHLMKTGAARLAHDLAHGTLVVVRVVERILTRIVRYLRSRRHQANTVPPEERKFTFAGMLSQMRNVAKPEEKEGVDVGSKH